MKPHLEDHWSIFFASAFWGFLGGVTVVDTTAEEGRLLNVQGVGGSVE